MVEDLREAVDFPLVVRVQCVLGGTVLMEERVLGGLEHGGWVVGEGAILLPDPGYGAVAGVGRGVVEGAGLKPKHFDGVADCMVLGCGLPFSVRLGGGGVHVADNDSRTGHCHLAVCFGEGLEERFRGVAEGDVDVDDVELPSVPTTSQTLSLPGMLGWWTRWTWMLARAYRAVPLCQYHLYAFWSGVYMGVVSGGSSRCRPCLWKVRRWGTHSAPCAIWSFWRAAVASLEYVMAGWLRSRRLTVASVGVGWGCGGLRPWPLPSQ